MRMSITYLSTVVNQDSVQRSYVFPTLRIVYITEGEAAWIIGQKLHRCAKGDIVLLNNSTERFITDVNGRFCLDIYEFLPVMFSDDIRLIERFYNYESCVIVHGTETCERVARILSEIKYDLLKDSSSKDAFSKAMLTAALVLISNGREETHKTEMDINMALRATALIWENYREDINAEIVAKQIRASKGQLEKSFKAMYGLSVTAYIRNYRVYKTANDIKRNAGRKNILDIALENGFLSSAGFYKAFKTVMNMSPKETMK